MVATARVDIKDLITGSGPFGPSEVRTVVEALGADAAAHRDLRAAVRDLESASERSPAASVKLGVCQRLLGRAREALETLKSADGGALALFHQALAHATEGAHDKACELFDSARKAGYDAATCTALAAESQRAAGRLDEAAKTLDGLAGKGDTSADYWAARAGVLADAGRPAAEIIACLEKALAADAGHSGALFLMGMIADKIGNDDEAIGFYEKSLGRYPASVGALVNLGLLYEDRDDYAKAQQCYRRVLEAYPDHPRARLFMRDSSASGDLQLDEHEMRQRDRLDQVMGLPVSDFELSVRSRNCLQKMGIQTLGDLARTSEEEILASKNFGETSLIEIKEMLASKGLSLGQIAAPAPAPLAGEPEAFEAVADDQEANNLPITELNLSVRARKCTTKLGITTIGDLVRRTAEDLLECKNFGVTSLNEVREKLTERGLKLRGD
ncbi:MAG: DNA-directed RNA polymerase subunit alpha C-terminal domain-containing protein [Planctomycetota bacterium]